MKEIGGYFELENLIGNEYHKDLIALNNARSALMYLCKTKKIRKLYLPYYLCDTVSDALQKQGYAFEYYNVDSQLLPIFDYQLNAGEFLYIVNLYGQLDNEIITRLKEKHRYIILDHTHSFFQRPIQGVDTIYSCRKFFGVPDGAYLATDKILEEELEVDKSKERMSHLLGRYEGAASDFYSEFIENNLIFITEPLKAMSQLSKNLLGAIDYEQARTIRNENYKVLAEQLSSENQLQLIAPDGAFAYPLYLENATGIRKKLIEQKIYIPLLWPNVMQNTSEESLEYQYAKNILPLPCDQRYSIEDMHYMVNQIKNLIGKVV